MEVLFFSELVVTYLAKLQEDFTKMICPFFTFLFWYNIDLQWNLCLIKKSVVTNLTEIK